MKKFETGKTYNVRSACDHNCVWTFKVISRTAAMVKLLDVDTNKTKNCRISKIYSDNNGEAVLPLGNYSMAPVLRA